MNKYKKYALLIGFVLLAGFLGGSLVLSGLGQAAKGVDGQKWPNDNPDLPGDYFDWAVAEMNRIGIEVAANGIPKPGPGNGRISTEVAANGWPNPGPGDGRIGTEIATLDLSYGQGAVVAGSKWPNP